jgi:hypothetical protein
MRLLFQILQTTKEAAKLVVQYIGVTGDDGPVNLFLTVFDGTAEEGKGTLLSRFKVGEVLFSFPLFSLTFLVLLLRSGT